MTVSLGTKDQIPALTYVTSVTLVFENVLNSFIFVLDEIPDHLLHQYMQVRLKQSVSEMRRERRMAWISRRSGCYHKPFFAQDHAHAFRRVLA